ncbi:X-ray repair cross-complementing protein 6 [Callorhinchus milii]|nr:X-ray repair cross-complementing protein 6 [Callorhinchus milii]
MADWQSHYPNDDGENPEEDEENEVETKYAGRDSLIFLVDASEAMFAADGNDISPFEMTIQCIRSVYTSKIISSDRDLLAVVFFGTGTHKNSGDFKHIYVLHDLDTPGAKRVLELDKYKEETGRRHFREELGQSSDVSLGEALWVCSNLFSDVKLKLSHKRVMLFTNNDDPHANDSAKARTARTKASDLQETGIILDLLHLRKPGGFDISIFYRDIINTADGEDLSLRFEESGKVDDLLRKVRAKDFKKKAMSRLNLKLGDGLELSVGVFLLIRSVTKPWAVRLSRESNEQVKTKTRWFNRETGSLLLPSNTKRAQIYGSRQITMEKEETEELRKFDEPGLQLVGFKPLSLLKRHHHIRPAQFMYPEESIITGSTILFGALLTKCLDREVYMLCRYTNRRNTPPRFVALVPQREEVDEQKIQTMPSGFHLVFLPFADDIRKVNYPEKVVANQDQVDKVKAVIHKLRFKYRAESFENPAIQQHFRNLEALALDLPEPETTEDVTLPKNDMINKRMGQLAEEFNELVYPPGYNPEAGATYKRKAGDAGRTGDKRPKAEVVSLSEEEVRQHVRKDSLGKLTVPVLKEVCRQYGLKTGKKQELMDAISAHFTAN